MSRKAEREKYKYGDRERSSVAMGESHRLSVRVGFKQRIGVLRSETSSYQRADY